MCRGVPGQHRATPTPHAGLRKPPRCAPPDKQLRKKLCRTWRSPSGPKPRGPSGRNGVSKYTLGRGPQGPALAMADHSSHSQAPLPCALNTGAGKRAWPPGLAWNCGLGWGPPNRRGSVRALLSSAPVHPTSQPQLHPHVSDSAADSGVGPPLPYLSLPAALRQPDSAHPLRPTLPQGPLPRRCRQLCCPAALSSLRRPHGGQ